MPTQGQIELESNLCTLGSSHPQGGASRRGSFVHIVPLDPAYKAGLAGHVPANRQTKQLTTG